MSESEARFLNSTWAWTNRLADLRRQNDPKGAALLADIALVHAQQGVASAQDDIDEFVRLERKYQALIATHSRHVSSLRV